MDAQTCVTTLFNHCFHSPLFHSTLLVAIAEMGDKTQLLAIILAARFQKPLAIIAGILAATLLNHAAAAWLGSFIGQYTGLTIVKYVIAASFILMGLWMLKPDKEDEVRSYPYGAFLTTCILFFMAEMGDKTQLATIALAAEHHAFWQVLSGTTLGMMLANVPAVLGGRMLLQKIPLNLMRYMAAVLFIGYGVYSLLPWLAT